MKTIIAGINAKYVHTALAARSIAAYARAHGIRDIKSMEFTINQPYDQILERLYIEEADAVLLSCYIWNWNICRKLVEDLRTLCPSVWIFLGGPQVSFHAADILSNLPADGIIRGEGEEAVRVLLKALSDDTSLSEVPSLTYRRAEQILENPLSPLIDLSALPFCYPDLPDLQNQMVYYESSRGCPYRCTYCLSGIDRSVRFKPIELVLEELKQFLSAGVQQVQFCDRTFNCRPEYCDKIWSFLIEHDNGRTHFHFEITADLLSDRQLALLKQARPGLFQFEIGVQSTYPPTLEAVSRQTDLSRLTDVCRTLKEMGCIHLHLDLIAGLPFEDARRFSESFDQVYRMKPDQLQLGFLKVLPGSSMEQDRMKYGIACRKDPPYEVLYTSAMDAHALFRLKRIARMVDIFYNSAAFSEKLAILEPHFSRPFLLYSALADRYEAHGYFITPPSRSALRDLFTELEEELYAD